MTNPQGSSAYPGQSWQMVNSQIISAGSSNQYQSNVTPYSSNQYSAPYLNQQGYAGRPSDVVAYGKKDDSY